MVSTLFTTFALIATGQAELSSVEETYVPNVRSEGVAEWEADGDRGLFIMSQDGGWYYARTAVPCPRLRSSYALAFETRGPDRLDRFGTVIAEGWRCPLVSVTRSLPPESRRAADEEGTD